MSLSASHRHGIITGASSGLGAALARRLGSAGLRLSLIARDRERLAAVAADCAGNGAETDFFVCDVTDAEGMELCIASIDAIAPIDLVIANAGIGGAASLAGNGGETSASARRIIETNLIGVINTVAPLVPRMAARQRGHIVIISSIAGLLGLAQSPSYCASKAALRTYAESLRRLMAPSGVKVSVVLPGYVDTPMSATFRFSKPLMWSAERAAAAIAKGLQSGETHIQFPWPLVALVRFASVLPVSVGDRLVQALSPKEETARDHLASWNSRAHGT
jgi:short-subunit dehydrogenase